MAYTKDQWDKTKAYYEAGLTLAKIKDRTGIARNTISQRAKREQWEQGKSVEYIEAKQLIAEKKGTILEQSGQVFLNTLDEIADDKIRRANLVYGVLENALKKNNDILEDGNVEDKINVGDGMQKFEKRKINPKETKEIIDGTVNAGKAFGIIETDKNVINNNNAQQTNNEVNNNLVVEYK